MKHQSIFANYEGFMQEKMDEHVNLKKEIASEDHRRQLALKPHMCEDLLQFKDEYARELLNSSELYNSIQDIEQQKEDVVYLQNQANPLKSFRMANKANQRVLKLIKKARQQQMIYQFKGDAGVLYLVYKFILKLLNRVLTRRQGLVHLQESAVDHILQDSHQIRLDRKLTRARPTRSLVPNISLESVEEDEFKEDSADSLSFETSENFSNISY